MPSDVLITPASSKIDFTDGSNATKRLNISGTAFSFNSNLNVLSSTSLSSAFKAEGVNGTLFEVTDDLSNSLMSVNTIGGLPVFEVFANNSIIGGQYGANDFVISGNKIGLGYANPVNKLSVSGSVSIGSSYNVAAPSNGLIVQGDVGIGVTSFAYSNANRANLEMYGSTDSLIALRNSSGNAYIQKYINDLYINNDTNGALGFFNNGSERWRITSAGVLQSNNAQTIQTSTGNLTLATAAGNGHILLTPHVNGNVGVNTATPVSKFVVNGGTVNTTTYTASEARIADGSLHLMKTVAGGIFESIRAMNADVTAGTTVRFLAASSSDPFNNANGGKVFIDAIRTSTNMDLAFSLNDVAGAAPVERVRFMGNGNVGIGTNNPSQLLHISSATTAKLKITADTDNADENDIGGIEISQDGGVTTSYFGFDSGNHLVLGVNSTSGPNIYLGTRTDGTSFVSSNDAKVTILNGGSVGIGTTNPVQKLELRSIVGDPYTSGVNQDGIMRFSNTTDNAVFDIGMRGGGTGAWLQSTDKTNLGVNYPLLLNPNGGDVSIGALTTANKLHVNGSVSIGSNYNTAATTNGLIVEGNVGIGVTGPTAKLDVAGTNVSGYSLLLRSGDNYNQTDSVQIAFGFANQTNYRHSIRTRHNPLAPIGGVVGNNIDFYVWKRGTDAAADLGSQFVMTMQGDGNVGIGTISPTQILDVRGNIKLGADSAGNYIYYVKDNEGTIIRTTRSDVSQEGLLRSDGWGNFTFNKSIAVGYSLGSGPLTGNIYASGSIGVGTTIPTAKLDTLGVRLGRDFSITNRATVRLDSNGVAFPSDVLFGHTVAANQDGWNGVYWSLSSRAAAASNRFYFYRGSGNPAPNNSEAVIMSFDPTLNVGVGFEAPTNRLSIAGSVSIGSGYNTAAPTNGLIVEGSVAIGATTASDKLTVVNGNISLSDSYKLYNGSASDSVGLFFSAALQVNISGYNGIIFRSSTTNIAGQTERMRIANNGNVGIGITVPSATLHLNSTTSGATLLRADGTNGTLFSVIDDLSDSLMSVNNSAGLPVLEVFADDRVVAGQYGANDFVLVNNKLGLGTNSPAYKLDVRGATVNARIGNLELGCWPFNANYAYLQNNALSSTSANYALLQSSTGETFLNAASGQVLHFRTGNNERWTIYNSGVLESDNAQTIRTSTGNLTLATNAGNGDIILSPHGSGKVGIGVTSPTQKLDIVGSYAAAGDSSGILKIRGGATGNDTQLNFGVSADGGYGWIQATDVGATNNINIILGPLGGNLGVGAVSANARVESYQSSNAITFNYLATNLNVNSPIPVYGFDVTSGAETRSIKAGIGYERHLANGRGTIHFYNDSTNDTSNLSGNRSSAGDIKMSIDNNGNVGIGITVPTSLLDVNGIAVMHYEEGQNQYSFRGANRAINDWDYSGLTINPTYNDYGDGSWYIDAGISNSWDRGILSKRRFRRVEGLTLEYESFTQANVGGDIYVMIGFVGGNSVSPNYNQTPANLTYQDNAGLSVYTNGSASGTDYTFDTKNAWWRFKTVLKGTGALHYVYRNGKWNLIKETATNNQNDYEYLRILVSLFRQRIYLRDVKVYVTQQSYRGANYIDNVVGNLSVAGYLNAGGQTLNSQSFYQWEGATYRNPGDHTPQFLLRKDNSSTGIDGMAPALALYNNNGGDQTTIGMVFVSAEAVSPTQGNAVNLAGIIAKKESAGTAGGWSRGSLNFFVKDLGAKVDGLTIQYTGRVGIGTTLPAASLQIGTGTPTATTGGIQFGDDTAARIYRDSSTIIKVTGGFQAATYVQAGNYLQTVGNLIYPASFSATQRLEVGNTAQNAWITGISIAPGGNVVVAGTLTATVIKADAGANYPHSFTNTDAGNTHWVNRSDRLLTSNGGGWQTDGRDPIMALVTSGNNNSLNIANSIGLALHNESQTNNTFSPAITFSNRSNSGGYNTTYAAIIGKKTGQGVDSNWSAGELHFYTMPVGAYIGSIPSLIINSAGNVGIGVIAPTAKLNVLSTSSLSSVFKTEGVNGTLFEVTDDLSNSLMSVNTIGGLPVFEVFANNSVIAGQYGQNDFVISGNKVGIGTASPVYKLDVIDNINSEPYSVAFFRNTNTSTSFGGIIVNGNNQAHIRFLTGASTWGAAGAKQWQIRTGAANNVDALSIYSWTTGSDVLYINSSGNVGINNTNPGYKLDVNGTSVFRDTVNIGPNIGTITWGSMGGGTGFGVRAESGRALSFGAGGSFDHLVINTDGRVGIGTTNPATLLQINTGTPISATGGIQFGDDAAARIYRISSSTIRVSNNLTVGGTLTESSSIRYKENVKTIIAPILPKLNEIRPVTYNKKDNPNNIEYGIIAEELNDLFPELVNKNNNGEVESVNYSRLTVLLIKAVKELKQEIEILKNK